MDQSYNLTRKHVAERRRRARINHYLQEIEHLVLPLDEQVSAIKLEKAEVLERTVAYLKQKRRTDGNETRAYTVGYVACLQSLQQLAKNISTQSDLHSIIATMLTNIKRRSTQTSSSVNTGVVHNSSGIASTKMNKNLHFGTTNNKNGFNEYSSNGENKDEVNQNHYLKLSSGNDEISMSSADQTAKIATKGDYSKVGGVVGLEQCLPHDINNYAKLSDMHMCFKDVQDEGSENMDCFNQRKRNEENTGQRLQNESALVTSNKTPFFHNNTESSSVWRPWSCFEF